MDWEHGHGVIAMRGSCWAIFKKRSEQGLEVCLFLQMFKHNNKMYNCSQY
jgi:hypothetical protein